MTRTVSRGSVLDAVVNAALIVVTLSMAAVVILKLTRPPSTDASGAEFEAAHAKILALAGTSPGPVALVTERGDTITVGEKAPAVRIVYVLRSNCAACIEGTPRWVALTDSLPASIETFATSSESVAVLQQYFGDAPRRFVVSSYGGIPASQRAMIERYHMRLVPDLLVFDRAGRLHLVNSGSFSPQAMSEVLAAVRSLALQAPAVE